MYRQERDFSALLGKTILALEGCEVGSESITLKTDSGTFRLYHEQDCCESVNVNDIIGDSTDIVGSPLLIAYEEANADGPKENDYDESHTWTFYRLATIKGSITLRWYGTSNGYYSESVQFVEI